MMTSKEHAKAIRSELKTLGYGRKEVSVRTRRVTYSMAIEVTIKSLGVDKEAVTQIAKKAEHVDRCAYSGEILSGGNTYVSVEYDHELDAAFKALASHLTFEKGKDTQVTDDIFAAWNDQYNCWSLWKLEGNVGSWMLNAWDVEREAGRCIDAAASRKAA